MLTVCCIHHRASELRQLLSGLGPSFVKIGQALSARPDLLPQPYLEALSELQDRLPSFPNEIAFAVMEEELGRPVHEVFSELTEQPVAAASLGQVRGTGFRVQASLAIVLELGSAVCLFMLHNVLAISKVVCTHSIVSLMPCMCLSKLYMLTDWQGQHTTGSTAVSYYLLRVHIHQLIINHQNWLMLPGVSCTGVQGSAEGDW